MSFGFKYKKGDKDGFVDPVQADFRFRKALFSINLDFHLKQLSRPWPWFDNEDGTTPENRLTEDEFYMPMIDEVNGVDGFRLDQLIDTYSDFLAFNEDVKKNTADLPNPSPSTVIPPSSTASSSDATQSAPVSNTDSGSIAPVPANSTAVPSL